MSEEIDWSQFHLDELPSKSARALYVRGCIVAQRQRDGVYARRGWAAAIEAEFGITRQWLSAALEVLQSKPATLAVLHGEGSLWQGRKWAKDETMIGISARTLGNGRVDPSKAVEAIAKELSGLIVSAMFELDRCEGSHREASVRVLRNSLAGAKELFQEV